MTGISLQKAYGDLISGGKYDEWPEWKKAAFAAYGTIGTPITNETNDLWLKAVALMIESNVVPRKEKETDEDYRGRVAGTIRKVDWARSFNTGEE